VLTTPRRGDTPLQNNDDVTPESGQVRNAPRTGPGRDADRQHPNVERVQAALTDELLRLTGGEPSDVRTAR